MAVGWSLHLGLNHVDPDHYQGWGGPLVGAEADARVMATLARAAGFQTTTLLLSAAATATAVVGGIAMAARTLRAGDLFLLTFAGHGGQTVDLAGDEEDNSDETWALYDRQLLDDELAALWRGFQPGIRIVVVSDSCHSGTVSYAPPGAGLGPTSAPTRGIPAPIQALVCRAHRPLYAALKQACAPIGSPSLAASVLLLAACQDTQEAEDGPHHGRFTSALLDVWSGGRFQGTYLQLHRQLTERMPPWQQPAWSLIGAPYPGFQHQRPFAIDHPGRVGV